MTIFGITGGSGSGKTAVSKMLSKLGVYIIDTDVIAREIVGKGMKCLCELTNYFGDEILNEDNSLNRRKLAAIAFSDKEKTKMLNKITHKYIKEKVLDEIDNAKADLIAIDGAVIIGSEVEELCEFIVSVLADKTLRAERIKKRDLLTDEQSKQRIEAQESDEFYKEKSLYIIYNNGSEEDLMNKVHKLYNIIREV